MSPEKEKAESKEAIEKHDKALADARAEAARKNAATEAKEATNKAPADTAANNTELYPKPNPEEFRDAVTAPGSEKYQKAKEAYDKLAALIHNYPDDTPDEHVLFGYGGVIVRFGDMRALFPKPSSPND